MGRTEETIQQEKPIQTSQTWEELKELRIKKLNAEIDFSVNKMVGCHIPMEALRTDVEKFKDGNITNCFEKWANVTQDQFVLNIVKFVLTMEFVLEERILSIYCPSQWIFTSCKSLYKSFDSSI